MSGRYGFATTNHSSGNISPSCSNGKALRPNVRMRKITSLRTQRYEIPIQLLIKSTWSSSVDEHLSSIPTRRNDEGSIITEVIGSQVTTDFLTKRRFWKQASGLKVLEVYSGIVHIQQ